MRTFMAVGLSALLAAPASAFRQPPLNLGSTSFFDGGPVKPGAYLIEYAVFTDGVRAKDHEGRTIPGGASVAALTLASQFAVHSPLRFAGANVGGHVTLPLVSVTAKGTLGGLPLPANTAGFGDAVVGPYLQWNGHTLLGRPFGHRLEFDVILPTGKYDPAFAVNPGSNHATYNPFYAFTWHFAEGWETSWRLQYAWHRENRATRAKAGGALHSNFAVSRGVHPKLRVGAAGYALKQVEDDRVAGTKVPDTSEQVLALGPGLFYHSEGFVLMLTNPIEFQVRNRFSGSRTVLQLLHRF